MDAAFVVVAAAVDDDVVAVAVVELVPSRVVRYLLDAVYFVSS